MTAPQFKAALRAQPFKPFELHLADGRSLPVRHPELALLTPGGRTVGVATDDDVIEVIDLLLVTSMRPHSNGAAAQ